MTSTRTNSRADPLARRKLPRSRAAARSTSRSISAAGKISAFRPADEDADDSSKSRRRRRPFTREHKHEKAAMAPAARPIAQLDPLPNADGSATFSYGRFTVIAAVNGPIEAPRRDESAFEALVDVIVRPAAGVGGMDRSRASCVIERHGAPGRRAWAVPMLLTSCDLRDAGTAERQLESILQQALRQLIPVRNFPRCMIQVTLQVMETPENAYVNAKILQPQLVRRPPLACSRPSQATCSRLTLLPRTWPSFQPCYTPRFLAF